MKIQTGDILTFDMMQWHDPDWEFGFPSCCLRPVFRAFEDGRHLDEVLESICLDAVILGELADHDYEQTWGHRYKLKTLEDRFKAVRYGAIYSQLQAVARRVSVRFVTDADGQLSWEILPAGSVPKAPRRPYVRDNHASDRVLIFLRAQNLPVRNSTIVDAVGKNAGSIHGILHRLLRDGLVALDGRYWTAVKEVRHGR